MSTKQKPRKKEFLTIPETAKLLKCTDINVYYHLKKGQIVAIDKATYIKTTSGHFVPTGETKSYIVQQSVKDKLSNTSKRKTKGKQIRAVYVDGIQKTFKNGKKEIIFPSETVAAEELEIGKFALRHRLLKKKLIREEVKVSVVPKEK